MVIYIVTYEGKSCYDAGGIFQAAFSTRENAEQYLSKFGRQDRDEFEIDEVPLDGEL